MKTFNEMFDSIPVPRSLNRHWARQDPAVLESVAILLQTHNAHPWPFVGDERHFEQFAGDQEIAAMNALTLEQYAAFIGCDE